MKREEFLNQLEYLLQDVAEEEKRDAIDYYRDYLDEAGPDNEEAVLAGFESPERIAAFIRTDLLGGMEKGGEFTEHGYEDKRFQTSSLPVVRKNTEDQEQRSYGDRGYTESSYEKGSYAQNAGREGSRKTENNWLKYILIAFAVLIASPIIFAVAMGLFGGVMGIGGVLLSLLLVVAILTIVGFACGIGLVIFGIAQLTLDLWFGVLSIGLGTAFIGAGCLFLVLAVMFYGRFLPWAVRRIMELARRILGNGTKKIKKSRKEDEQ